MFELDIELDDDAAAVLADLAKREISLLATMLKIIEAADRFEKAAAEQRPITAIGITLTGLVLSKTVFHVLEPETMTMTTERYDLSYSIPYLADDGSYRDLLEQ